MQYQNPKIDNKTNKLMESFVSFDIAKIDKLCTEKLQFTSRHLDWQNSLLHFVCIIITTFTTVFYFVFIC